MKKTNKLFAILLAVFMMAVVAPMAFAADEVVTIDLANGNVTITETGYSIDGGAETPFTGDYIITGKNDETKMANVIQINSLAEGSDITLKDVDIAQKGPACIKLNVDATLKATGTVKLSNTAPTISADGKNVVITGDADILVNTGVYFAYAYQGTIEIACKSLDVTGTGSAPIIYECTDFKVNATEDVALNGWISANNIDIVAGGDIFVGNANSTAPLLQGTTSLKSTNGDITLDHKGMICTGLSLALEAAGDVKVNADSGSPAITAMTTTIIGNNVILSNASGAVTSSSALDITATGDVRINANTSGPAITGGTTIKGDNVTVRNDAGAVTSSSSSALDITATGDVIINAANTSGSAIAGETTIKGDNVTINANTSNPAITGETTIIKGDNVTVRNDAGAVISSSSLLDITATGDIDFSGNTSGASLIWAGEINLTGDDVTFANNGIASLISGNSLEVDAAGKFTAVGASYGPIIDLQSVNTLDITAGSVEIENTQDNGIVIAANGVVNATTGDISIKGIQNNSGIVVSNLTATAKNGTVTLQNDGSGFVSSGIPTINAQNIILANPNATSPVTPTGYDLTADENITVITGFATTTYDNPRVESYDFGNKLTITTSAGTTEHTHSYVDVEYNNDATCTADGTKLVKCDCEWAKEKTVTAEGTALDHSFTKYEEVTAPECGKAGKEVANCDNGCDATDEREIPALEHIDDNGDYLCDYDCGYEFEKPADEACPDCGRPVHGDGLMEKIICWFVMLINLVKSMF